MNDPQREAIATIALMAAFADGSKADSEREEVRRVAETLDEGQPEGSGLPMTRLYRDVLLKRASLEQAVAQLDAPETRALAYELAVGVVDADGLRNAPETAFLADLAARLGLAAGSAQATLAEADALVTAPLEGDLPTVLDAAVLSESTAGSLRAPASASASTPDEAELDKLILNAALLNGGLELLPQSLASMAIIPLQMRMVYNIGSRYGYTLDKGAIRDLLATLGVGVTGQYLEEVGRKLLGGLLGKVGGKLLGGLGRTATGVAFSFGTTWAIGQVARRYYAGGRTMSAEALKAAFASLQEEARGMQDRYAPQIQAQSRQIDLGKVLQQIKGN